jgi:AcrR family transcriptional regulator
MTIKISLPAGEPIKKTGKPKTSYKKSALTRQRIYEAGMTLMTERGYQGATIRDICKRAHVSAGAFYSYFESKIDLLKDIYAAGDLFFQEEVAGKTCGKAPDEQIRIFARSYGELNTRTGFEMVRVLYNPENEWFARKRPMQDVLYEIVSNAQKQGVIRADLTVDDLVNSIFIALRGVCFTWCVRKGCFNLEETMVKETELLWEGLTPR